MNNKSDRRGTSGRLVENMMHFARVLRTAGLPVGPGRVLDALQAVQTVGITRRDDLYWTLHALFVRHPRQRELFDQAFHIFWKNPRLLEQMIGLVMPGIRVPETDTPRAQLNKRLTDAFFPDQSNVQENEDEAEEEDLRATMTWSDREQLNTIDFESMSAEEMREAERVIARMNLAARPIKTRRFRPESSGSRIDMRATIRAGMRSPAQLPLVRSRPRERPPALVTLCDISGSMSQYSRIVVHFMHAVTTARDSVHSFVFGTRLSNISRHLRHKDVDLALSKVSDSVDDWSGGTRIGECLKDFNQLWSRRVLAQGAIVILISDGLDRDAGEGLAQQMRRLQGSCRRLIWLNPLLRYSGFEPRTGGTRAMLPFVDDFRTIHNLDAMAELATLLSAPGTNQQSQMHQWVARSRN